METQRFITYKPLSQTYIASSIRMEVNIATFKAMYTRLIKLLRCTHTRNAIQTAVDVECFNNYLFIIITINIFFF